MAYYDHYNNVIPSSIGLKIVHKIAALLMQTIVQVHPSARTALEIGPGRGAFCELWQKKGGSVFALEISEDISRNLASRGIETVNCKAPPLPFGTSCFDAVVASHVLEHMPDLETAIDLIREMKRVCREDGVVVIVCPDARSMGLHFWNVDYTHNLVTTPRRIVQMFYDHGLIVEKVVIHSAYLKGFVGWVIKLVARLIPSGLLFSLPISPTLQERLYRLQTTFLGGFIVVARKR